VNQKIGIFVGFRAGLGRREILVPQVLHRQVQERSRSFCAAESGLRLVEIKIDRSTEQAKKTGK
jgi:Tfp pilus assembly protein PilX